MSILKEVDLSATNLAIMIYGANGAGKTHLAATLPGQKLFLNHMGNLETLTKFPKDGPDGWKALELPTNWNDIQKVFTESLLDDFPNLIWDNFTGTYRYLIEEQSNTGAQPGIQVYGLASERLRWIASKLRDRRAKQNVIAICHTMAYKDEVTQTVVAGPSVPGQVPAHITSIFPELIYLKGSTTSKNGKSTPTSIASLAETTIWPAATRILTEARYENPNLALMYKDRLSHLVRKPAA